MVIWAPFMSNLLTWAWTLFLIMEPCPRTDRRIGKAQQARNSIEILPAKNRLWIGVTAVGSGVAPSFSGPVVASTCELQPEAHSESVSPGFLRRNVTLGI